MATPTVSLLDLPDELLVKILDHVDLHSLVRSVSCTCRTLQHLSRADHIWKRLCAKYWLDKVKEHTSTNSWHENFCAWKEKWGRYIDCYARVKSLWNQIENTLAERSPSTLHLLNGPVGETVIQQLCDMGKSPLPPEVCCFYLIHNGQRVVPGQGSLLGGLEVYDYLSMEVAVPLEFSVKNSLSTQGSLMLSWCPYANYGQALCLKASSGLQLGCVYYLNEVGRNRRPHGYFITASSFLEWLQKLADRLADPELEVSKAMILKFYHEPSCVAVTRDVKVTVATAFVPRLSQIWKDKRRALFAYHISMSMDENAPKSRACKLQSRHWEITDSTGEYHEVNGEAVIGLYPVIAPGTKFSYASWTPFDCEGGFMEGHFTFINLQSGEKYDVACPRFNMKCPPISMVTTEEGDCTAGDGDFWDQEYSEDDDEDDEF